MNTSKKKLTLSVVALLAVIGGVLGLTRSGNKSSEVATAPEPQPQPVATDPRTTPAPTDSGSVAVAPTPAVAVSKYKDGTYSAVGTYDSPGGSDDLNVTVTLKNGIVTSANVTSGAHDPRSERYQQAFIGGYKEFVVGKPIDSITLDVVSGSSLTPAGFNDALDQIKAQAKA